MSQRHDMKGPDCESALYTGPRKTIITQQANTKTITATTTSHFSPSSLIDRTARTKTCTILFVFFPFEGHHKASIFHFCFLFFFAQHSRAEQNSLVIFFHNH